MDASDQIPVSVLTGFLGSGKTTLLSRLLKHPGAGRMAVVINEFGEVPLDHDLVAAATDDAVVLEGGCICCTVRSDMIETLRSLFLRRAKGDLPPFERLLIETTGLADPAPILHTLMADPLVATRYRLDSVIATVDAVNAATQLDRHEESIKQVAVADRLLLTKTDLIKDPASERDLAGLEIRLHQLNPAAPLYRVVDGHIDPETLFGAGLYDPSTKRADVARWLREEAYAAPGDGHEHHHHGADHHHAHEGHEHRHDAGIRAYCIYREAAMDWSTWVGWLEALIATRGNDILRMKGILNVTGLDAPVAVHGVQHLFHPPALLDAWPSDDRRSRLVFITQNIGQEAVTAMLEAWAKAAAPQA